MLRSTTNSRATNLAAVPAPTGTATEPAIGADWLSDFSKWLMEKDHPCKEETVKLYLMDIRIFCRWFHAANNQLFQPSLMNSTDVRTFRTWSLEIEEPRPGKHISPATWNRRRASLKSLCDWIQDVKAIPLFNFNQKIPAKVCERHAPRWLSAEEERRTLRQSEISINTANTENRRVLAIRDQAMLKLMRYAGLRVREVAQLELGDLALSARKGSVVIRSGKRDKSRKVPLSPEAAEALREWLEVRGPGAPRDPLFTAVETGEFLSTRAIQKRIQRIASSSQVSGLSPHPLRHTCGKRMIDAGRPITEVQRILGHERIETTVRYIEPGQEDLEDAVAAGELGKLVFQTQHKSFKYA